ncbi:hypothetical protein GOP47_0012661 [Adiantum capillus-veneris]|uniref:Uncharacterized protein n=1 Tax=Adiantum capillus-veneris TaxID=13818 RepID=A0A9D4UR40_ADICA|nr:hypothetical protein GOP47_0012661 [Adiantum capillus-veneris]
MEAKEVSIGLACDHSSLPFQVLEQLASLFFLMQLVEQTQKISTCLQLGLVKVKSKKWSLIASRASAIGVHFKWPTLLVSY